MKQIAIVLYLILFSMLAFTGLIIRFVCDIEDLHKQITVLEEKSRQLEEKDKYLERLIDTNFQLVINKAWE